MTPSARPIRILQLLVSTRIGGGPRQVFETIRRLPRQQFRWVIGAPDDGPYAARFAEIGTVHRLPLHRLRPSTLLAVMRLIRAEDIDVVHSHGKGAGVYGRLAARATGAVAVHTFHGIHAAKYGAVGGAAYRALERGLARLTYAVVNVSEAQARAGERLGLWSPGRAIVIPNGVDAEAVRALARAGGLSPAGLGLPPGGRVIACVARLDPVKGVDVFVRAVARLDPAVGRVQALVVGSGPEEGRLRALAAALEGGDRVVFTGEVPDAPRLFGGVDLYVSASRSEGLPLAVLEAMACGLPIVATRIAAHEEILGDGPAGILVRVDDPADLADAIARALRDDALRARLGEAALQAVARYDIASSAAALGDLYRRAAGARGRLARLSGEVIDDGTAPEHAR